jgi:hypothetical protein
MRNVMSAVFVASSLAVSAAAQGQQPPTQAQPPAAAQPAKVTISGCLQTAPRPEAGAPSSTSAAKFELANAKSVSNGPVGTSGSATPVTRYQIEGDEKTITPHLNHQVEISGTLAVAPPAGSPAAPMLKVESVKMVAAECS